MHLHFSSQFRSRPMSNRRTPALNPFGAPDIVRNPDGTFAKGVSGNPAGKPKGTRGHLARALDDLIATDALALLAKTVELGKDGDVAALRLILGRAWPMPKG